jgi:uncharacterized protein
MKLRAISAGLLGAFFVLTILPRTSSSQTANLEPPNAYQEAKRKANENVVTIIASGRLTGYTQFAEDISNVLNATNSGLRVIPVIGAGAGQNVLDMLYLKGTDMGIVDQDILAYMKRKDPRLYGDIDRRIHYIAKLFNTALHVYAKKDIRSLEELAGKKVSCLKPLSTVAIFCENLFLALGIKVEIVHDDAGLAMEKVKRGEIAAAARGAQPPLPGFEKVAPVDDLHFIPISEESLPNSNYAGLRTAYLPARLKAEHYPTMIPPGQEVPTVATGSLLAAYAWPAGSERHQRLALFVKTFFDNIDKFPKPPRHPGWADVNLATEIPGWTRFPAAQEWLSAARQGSTTIQGGATTTQMKTAFNAFIEEFSRQRGGGKTLSEAEKSALWDEFQTWWAARPSQ